MSTRTRHVLGAICLLVAGALLGGLVMDALIRGGWLG
jgi:hypothetical protein